MSQLNSLSLPPIVLASASPRRAEILASVGWPFEKMATDIDESVRTGEVPEQYVVRLAIEKAAAILPRANSRPVIGADTTVVVDGEILGKPVDLDDARKMLRKLSGKTHDVLTGVAIVTADERRSDLERTSVRFRSMSDEEIEFLAREGDPLDKAGGYAVQAQAALFIERIDGDYWNVVGLPVGLLYQLVMKRPG